jgi:thiosulfate dehydrogenase [quinone] large subunit
MAHPNRSSGPTRRRPTAGSSRPAPVPEPPPHRRLTQAVASEPSAALLPLRAFLGITFCFAGLQKLANPNFFRSASPISIQAQIRAAARTSPIHGLLHHLVGAAGFIGLVIALAELAIGLGVLAGVLTRVAALGGMLLSFSLFLTVSFHSRPYYTGADIGYVFAFTPLLIAGARDRFTLPALVERMTGLSALRYRYGYVDEDRRRVLVLGGLGAFGLLAAALSATMGRLIGGTKPPHPGSSLSGSSGAAPSTTSPTTTQTAGPTTSAPVSTGKPAGTAIGPASGVPVGGAATFQDPSSGDPAVVIQPKAGQFVAFDAVCPHAGCTVEYDPSQTILVCPCHGSLFSASTGAVEQGPAASGLRPISISEGSGGQLFVT